MNFRFPLATASWDEAEYDAFERVISLDQFTMGELVAEFESNFATYFGSRFAVMVNSGSSANLLTLTALRETHGLGEIIVPPLTWVSDIAAVLQCGFKPVFADIHPRTLGLHDAQVLSKITKRTKAVFLTHILGYNALTQRLLDELASRGITLIEAVSESHGSTFCWRKLGTYGVM
mgnify:CR=1 FL=1